MATITLGGKEAHTFGDIPAVGSMAPDFKLVKNDMSRVTLGDFRGSKLVLNIFPSVDTGVCAASIRKFNEEAAKMDGVQVLNISKDLPFAQARFCGAEGIDKAITLSDFASGQFGKDYQLEITDGAFANLLSRVVLVLDEEGLVLHAEQVPEIGQEPDYKSALAALK